MSPHRRGSATCTAVALLCVLLVACGGTRDPGPTAELDTEDPFGDDAARLAEPASRGADDDRLASEDAPGPSLRSETTAPVRPRLDRAAADPPSLEPVTPQRPAVRVDDVTGDVLPQVLGIDGVRFATVVSLGELALEDGPLRVVAVEPFGFRQVVPAVTADGAGVWDRLAGGEVVLDPPAGRRLGVGPGEGLQTADGGTVTVGAWASHAEPALADALMTHATADGLGVVGTQTVLVTLHDGVRAADVTGRLEALDLGEVTALDDGAVHTTRLVGTDAATLAAFEPFRYVDAEDGRITVDPDWVDRHVATADVPVLGEVTCHRSSSRRSARRCGGSSTRGSRIASTPTTTAAATRRGTSTATRTRTCPCTPGGSPSTSTSLPTRWAPSRRWTRASSPPSSAPASRGAAHGSAQTGCTSSSSGCSPNPTT